MQAAVATKLWTYRARWHSVLRFTVTVPYFRNFLLSTDILALVPSGAQRQTAGKRQISNIPSYHSEHSHAVWLFAIADMFNAWL